MRKTEEIYLIGAGGHAKVILALLETLGRGCLGIYDDDKNLWGTSIYGVPVLGTVAELPDNERTSAVIAIGDNAARLRIAKKFSQVRWATLVHPCSWIHKTVSIGEGSVVITGAIIHPDSTIGAHSIINTAAVIEHECRIGSFCHIAPGCHLAGGVTVGDNTFLGVGTNVIPRVSIAANTVIGAGSVVIKDIVLSGTYVGVPVRRLAIKGQRG